MGRSWDQEENIKLVVVNFSFALVILMFES